MLNPTNYHKQSLFIIWNDGLALVPEIRADLAKDSVILADVRIIWSANKAQSNLRRLYQKPLIDGDTEDFSSEKITKPVLHVFYVETLDGRSALHRSATGEIEEVNPYFISKKELYRSWAVSEFNYSFLVHCAASSDELRLQTVLFFGTEGADLLWAGERYSKDALEGDLVGSEGWDSLEAAFHVLSYSVDWVVLRGWESLPKGNVGDDLDILVRTNKTASSALCLLHKQQDRKFRNGQLRIAREPIKVDLHWIHDGYFDPTWQLKVLEDRVVQDWVFRPSTIDAFFTLIYAEYVNRKYERKSKIERLKLVSKEIRHTGWLNDDMYNDRGNMLQLLSKFMESRGYVWVTPVVQRFEQAADAVYVLPKANLDRRAQDCSLIVRTLAHITRYIMPVRIRSFLVKYVRKQYISKNGW